jgi:hypothetical protein
MRTFSFPPIALVALIGLAACGSSTAGTSTTAIPVTAKPTGVALSVASSIATTHVESDT